MLKIKFLTSCDRHVVLCDHNYRHHHRHPVLVIRIKLFLTSVCMASPIILYHISRTLWEHACIYVWGSTTPNLSASAFQLESPSFNSCFTFYEGIPLKEAYSLNTKFQEPILLSGASISSTITVYTSVPQLPGRGRVPGSGINYTGPSSYRKKNLLGRGLTKVENHWSIRSSCQYYRY
jgi:hypothetical protein